MTDHQASRAEHQGPVAVPRATKAGDCNFSTSWGPCQRPLGHVGPHVTEGIIGERDPLPPDKDALGLVKAILEQANFSLMDSKDRLRVCLATIGDSAERLKVLLADRDAEREELVAAMKKADDALAQAGWGPVSRPRAEMRVALARLKGAS